MLKPFRYQYDAGYEEVVSHDPKFGHGHPEFMFVTYQCNCKAKAAPGRVETVP
jgi:hypothetical protein